METLRELFEVGLERPKERHLRWRDPSGRWRSLSTAELAEQVDAAARGLCALGLSKGDRVALLARNSERWAIADFAMASAGLVNVPLYPTQSPEQVQFILDDSGCRVLLVEDTGQLERLKKILADAYLLKAVVLADDDTAPEAALSWSGLLELGRSAAPIAVELDGHDLASIIYTSGTTGHPKGVMLSHRNLVSNAVACAEAIDLSSVPEQVNLSLLPLCHIFQRLVDYFLFASHAVMVYCPNPLEALEYIKEVRPTFFAAVPRLFEKVRAGFLGNVAAMPSSRRRLAEWALAIGRRRFHAWYRGGSCDGRPGLFLSWQHAVADRLVLSKVRQVFGGRVDLCFSGGAALPPEVHEFLRAVGLQILPGYGLTESSPVISTNRQHRMRLGSVGPALRGVEIRLAEDGELLARGPNVMLGYWRRDEETARALREGWLHTGDLASIDEDGYLSITGRKKDILVLSTGKNVSPQVVEDQLSRSPFVLQVVCLGDSQKFVSALVRPNAATLGAEARRRGLGFASDEELLASRETEDIVLESFEQVGSALSAFERPKRIAFLPRDLSLEAGELTPTLKYKRRVISENWREPIQALYRSESREPAAVEGGRQ